MPKESYEAPARHWPTIEDAIRTAIERVQRHDDAPEVPSFPPIETQNWREGGMLITLAHGPEVDAERAVAHLETQLLALTNLLAMIVRERGGEVRIDRRKLEDLDGVVLHSAHDKATGEQVLTTRRVGPNGQASRLILPGRF